MLKGTSITLRPVRESDLEQLYAFHVDIDNRGEFFPRTIVSWPAFRKQFDDDGYWNRDEGMLVIAPGNAASRRLAATCGFRHEGTARGAWYNAGRHHDVEIYAILHDEVIDRTPA